MTTKRRISASEDAELVDRGQEAVDSGEVETLSAWINQALRGQVERDRRLRAMDSFLSAYEAEHGEITDQEIQEATRRARSRAIVVRPTRSGAA